MSVSITRSIENINNEPITKNVIIRKISHMENTNTTLSDEQIEAIMKEMEKHEQTPELEDAELEDEEEIDIDDLEDEEVVDEEEPEDEEDEDDEEDDEDDSEDEDSEEDELDDYI